MGQGLTEGVASSVRGSAEHLLDKAGGLLPAIAAAVTVLAISWALATLARRVSRSGVRFVENPTQRNLLRQVSYYTVWAVGVFVALEVLGLDVHALIAGLGLGGVALGFALKDILSNLVSGLLILVEHTFEIGDQIVVGETEGTVEQIEVRATHLRTYDGRLVLVPNGEVFTSRVTNNTASPLRRASVFVYLDYHQDLERALSVIL
ncbi:MAG: mechanosensitive ion channel [Deltaproteobacteria bacterium]|nr:mechanosensitive ion channel [Deltaproteobacteria bacterium]